MEVVLLVVAVLGVALIVAPRLQPRRSTPRTRRPARRAPAASPVATWTPDEDGWDDDLGSGAAGSREAWKQWRSTQSGLVGVSDRVGDEPPEPPSGERARTAASRPDDEWDEDDGLGWEGDDAPPPGETRIWSRRPGAAAARPEVAPVADPAVASAAVHAPPPDNGYVKWEPEARQWTAGAGAVTAAPAPRRTRARVHPVLLVAIYAAVGIGLIVLASTFLLGGGSSSPAKQTAPRATATPIPTPDDVGSAADLSSVTEDPAADAVAAAERKARRAARLARQRALRAVRTDVAKARAAARKRARAAAERKRRAALRNRASAPRATSTPSPSGSGASSPPPAYTQPATPKPRPRPPVCEFCIG